MTIPEAIESIKEVKALDCHVKYPEWQEALQLGIEALKAIKDWRGKSIINQLILLPGETKE